MSNSSKIDKSTTAKAGAAGGGIGTVIAALAENMPDESEWKSALIIIAPLMAVGISGIWIFVKESFIDPIATKRRFAGSDEVMDFVYEQAKKQNDEVQADPHASDAHKAEVRKNFENISQQRLNNLSKRMEIVP